MDFTFLKFFILGVVLNFYPGHNPVGIAFKQHDTEVLRPTYGLTITTTSFKNAIRMIAPNRRRITLEKYEPLDMTCNARGNPNPDIYWMKNNQTYSSNRTIMIRAVETTDSGIYTCVAENTFGKQMENIMVVINVPPFLLSTAGLAISTNTSRINKFGVTVLNRVQVPDRYFNADYEQIIKTNESEKILLACNMGGNPRPKINWFKNDVNLNRKDPVLEYTSASIENSGIYKCVGSNNIRNKKAIIFYLNVQKPISIVSATSTKTVYEKGDEIKLTCKTKGNQLPVIVWRRIGYTTDNANIFKPNNNELRKKVLQQDEPLYLNRRKIIKFSHIGGLERYGKVSYEFIDGEYIGTLEYVIKSAKLTDAGQYWCIARMYKVKNLQIIDSVEIDVVEAPYLENATTTYSMFQGISRQKIKCPIKGMPTPTIEWYRENSEITYNQDYDVQNDFLEFKNPMTNLTGEYSCRGTNKGGSTEFKFNVNILPHTADLSKLVLYRSHHRKIKVPKNDTIVLECSIKSTPIYWSKLIDSYPHKQRQLLEANSSAYEYNFFADTSSRIMCSKDADSKYGEIFEITVLEKPTIQPNEINVEVKLDDTLQLKCNATGEPKPTIKWYRYEGDVLNYIGNYSKFNTYGKRLFKRHAEYSDTTKYMCTAQNRIGTDSHTFDVTVTNDTHYFTKWNNWSRCSKTCGKGIQFRIRHCIHESCNLKLQREVRKCTTIECPIDGGWSDLSPFSECSKTCVISLVGEPMPTRQARRNCNNPPPAFGGRNCCGSPIYIENCTVPLCELTRGQYKQGYSGCWNHPTCPAGFEYESITESCQEIDKCKRKGPYAVCRTESETCQNMEEDDYECVCRPGFRLEPSSNETNDPKKNPNCVDINECEEEPNPCGLMKCSNTRGSYKCLRKRNYF